MSYDFSMVADLGGKRPISLGFDMNYTYNVSEMFYSAIGNGGIKQLKEMKGSDCLPILESAIKKMETDPVKYKGMNPSNGWGCYEGALNVLRTLKEWCEEAPNAIMVIE